ncbi:cation:proton antiporter [Patescibacteria group bacterium]|nr:cation:proton antiporter [Patescibacteria group bacterium]
MLVIAAVLGNALGEISAHNKRFKLPEIVGWLGSGLALGFGAYVAHVHDFHVWMTGVVYATIAEAGVALLLYHDAALPVDPKKMFRVKEQGLFLAISGIILVFALCYKGARILVGLSHEDAIIWAFSQTPTGMAATVTSVGADTLRTCHACVIFMTTTFIDDDAGLVNMQLMPVLAGGGGTGLDALKAAGKSLGLFALAFGVNFVLGKWVFSRIIRLVAERTNPQNPMLALTRLMNIFAILSGIIAKLIGQSMVVGSFAAGLGLNEDEDAKPLIGGEYSKLKQVAKPEDISPLKWVNPLAATFFTAVAAELDWSMLQNPNLASKTFALTGISLVSLFIAKMTAAFVLSLWYERARPTWRFIAWMTYPRGEIACVMANDAKVRFGSRMDSAIPGSTVLVVILSSVLGAIMIKRAKNQLPPELLNDEVASNPPA